MKAVQPREWWDGDVHMMACLSCGGGVPQNGSVHGMHPNCADNYEMAAGRPRDVARTQWVKPMQYVVHDEGTRAAIREDNARLSEEDRAHRKAVEKDAAKAAKDESSKKDS